MCSSLIEVDYYRYHRDRVGENENTTTTQQNIVICDIIYISMHIC